ncbi:MAG: hypothetical protein A3F10_01100 [Coxiella sp. RIFCSPHIGHO2_12_FULL_42_15]|nr:MAG: hypothetical protein A3F10_01100 [Coxiella sp. RIFCSPHIGHO2_12_FULL_42_15]
MFEHYLESANQFLVLHPYYGLLFAFLVAFAESLPILGTLIPGSITMTFIGIVVGRNLMPIGMTLLLATVGALVGDMIGYLIGKHYKERLHDVWPFRKHEKLLKLLKMGEAFFEKHGGKSIVIGRFIGPTRSSVPLIAGLMKMRWPNFLVAALPSAFLWALLYLLPGILIGSISLVLPKDKATSFTFISLAFIVFLWLIFWAIQRFFVFIAGIINRYVDRSWNWLNRHHSSQLLIRLITCQRKPEDHHQLTLAFFTLLFALFFIFVFLCVKFQFALYHLNQPIFYFLQSLRGHRSDVFFITFTELGDKYTLLVISLIIAGILAIRKQWYALWHLLILMFFAFGSVWVIKHIYYLPRPSGFLEVAKSSSFPSGHTTLSLCLLGFFSYLCASCIEKVWRWIPFTIASLFIFLIALSRIYLGAHWFCDILAGIALSFTLLLAVLISYRRWKPDIRKPFLVITCIFLAILLPWCASVFKNYHKETHRFTEYFPQQIVSIDDWWNFPGAYLPIYRVNRFGSPTQPFNIQWAGNLSAIKQLLKKKGWQEIKFHENLQSALRRFASKEPEQHLPFLPQLYRQQPPALFMIKRISKKNRIIELRLWNTGVSFTQHQLTLLIGSINFRRGVHSVVSLNSSRQTTLENGGGTRQLSQDIQSQYQIKRFSIRFHERPEKTIYLNWDGDIVMIRAN